MTFLRSRLRSRKANLPAVVVLPEPCKPAIKITAGGLVAIFNGAASPPSISIKASWTILITCWSGRTARMLATPTAFSRTFSVKAFTAGKATSASSKASRTSRSAASTSDSLSAPRRASPSKTSANLLFSVSNMVLNLLALGYFALPPSSKLRNAAWHPCSKTSRTCGTR